ncbi:MAG: type II toxin-antitoxin system HicB family antitoxin [Planctomycetes bacterium]|nr:type II toxin-antitoxin system HicB family antitoxin [Planctomycetota bacterium]
MTAEIDATPGVSAGSGTHREMSIHFGSGAYECHILIFEEPGGGYVVRAAQLPGAWSQGETPGEAIANIREAIAGLLRVYLEDGEIPWSDSETTSDGEPWSEKWIVVDV